MPGECRCGRRWVDFGHFATEDDRLRSTRSFIAVYPELTRIRDCSHAVACAVIRRALAEGHASPGILAGLEETVRRAMWFPKYRPVRYRRRPASA